MHIESGACVNIVCLTEFKLLAGKHLFSIPVTGKIYINTGVSPRIFHWKKTKREGIRFSFIPELTEDENGFVKLFVEHLVAPWHLSCAFLSGTSLLVWTLDKCTHFHHEFGDVTISISQLESQHRDYRNFLTFKQTVLEVFLDFSRKHETAPDPIP